MAQSHKHETEPYKKPGSMAYLSSNDLLYEIVSALEVISNQLNEREKEN